MRVATQQITRQTLDIVNRFLLIIVAALLTFSSCRTTKKVLYFQDMTQNEEIATQAVEPLKFEPGDRLTVIVTSGKTPDLAVSYNLPVMTIQAGTTTQPYSNQISPYTVDENGCIDVPSLGKVKVAGLTRAQVSATIQDKLRNGNLLKDAVVTVNAYDQYVTIMGEVKNPGKINIRRDNITLLQALGEAGDLTIQARRDSILVIRQEGNVSKSYFVDLRSKNLLNSPVYNLKQNDIVYVKPNKVRAGQSTVNDNSARSISTWLSISSFLLSLAILIFN